MKVRIFQCFALVVFLFSIVFAVNMQESVSAYEEINLSQDERGVNSWVNNFVSRNFRVCDAMIQNKGDCIYNNKVLVTPGDSRYYERVLDALVNCINKVELIRVEMKEGVSTYTYKLEYTPYLPLEELEYNESTLDKAKDAYENAEISKDDLISEFERVYLELFYDNCFKTGSESCETYLTLSEKDVDGVTYVYNTVSFVNTILSDSNITQNLAVYEYNAKDTVDKIIKAN